MKIRREILEDAFTLVVLFLATEAFQSFLVDPRDPHSGTDGSVLLRILWFIVYGVVLIRLAPRYRRVAALVRANWCLALLLLLALSSTIWSQDPSLTLRRSTALVATTLIGMDLALRYSVRDQVRLLCIVLCSVVLFGVLAQLLFPTLVPNADFDSTAWHGVSGAKNEWARIIVLAAITVVSRSRRSLRGFLVVAGATLIAVGLIGLARSMGALVILIGLQLIYQLFGVLSWRPRLLIVVALTSMLIGLPMTYLLLRNFDKATALLGRDVTLTGRVAIWPLALTNVANNPVHGYGYSAFWAPDSQPATRIREEVNWDTPSAHNGYIDLALGLGLPGALLFIAGLFISAKRAIDFLRRGVAREATWPLAYLTFFFLYQFVEGTIVAGNTIYWIVFVAVCCSVTEFPIVDQVELRSDTRFIAPMRVFSSRREQWCK
jgi:exopolysaccharide production protein ExoQ